MVLRAPLSARGADMADAREAPCAVIRLTTGRFNVRALGAAARVPALDPSLASRLGLALTRFRAGALRIALDETCTIFRFTASPCSSVLRDTALNPPRTFIFA
jgi:hypothetical protein